MMPDNKNFASDKELCSSWSCELWRASTIRMSHWCHTMVDGAKFWISCQWLAFLSIFSRWQLIQNSAPSTIMWRQCDIQIRTILTVHTVHKISYKTYHKLSSFHRLTFWTNMLWSRKVLKNYKRLQKDSDLNVTSSSLAGQKS